MGIEYFTECQGYILFCSAYNGAKFKIGVRRFMETRSHAEEVLPKLIPANVAMEIHDGEGSMVFQPC